MWTSDKTIIKEGKQKQAFLCHGKKLPILAVVLVPNEVPAGQDLEETSGGIVLQQVRL